MSNLERKIILELSESGVHVSRLSDLVNFNIEYGHVIGILVKHLNGNILDNHVREFLIRSLTIKLATGLVNDRLFELYDIEFVDNIKWVIGNAFDCIIQERDVERIINIIENKKNGISRQMFVLALRRYKLDSVETKLNNWLQDKDIRLQTLSLLKKYPKDSYIQSLTNIVKASDSPFAKRANKILQNI